jgi:hypothetical protein
MTPRSSSIVRARRAWPVAHPGLSRTLAIFVSLAFAWPAAAQTITAPGYVRSFLTLSDTTQSCVATAEGGTFVGRGPGFTANAQSVVFVTESGVERVVASGFNSISDCAYDRVPDVLYVTDNSYEVAGALTGDTVFAIPAASTATDLSAVGLELVPKGGIPSAASVAVAPNGDVYVSDSVGGAAGSVRRFAAGALSPFIGGGLDFAAGLAFENGGTLLVAETLDSFASQISRYDANGNFLDVVSGPGFDHGSYDLAFAYDGRVLVTGAFDGPVVAVDTTTGTSASIADGFTFATAIDVDSFTGRVELVSSSFVGADEDYRLHRLTPVAKLSPMGGTGGSNARRECLTEFYGIDPAFDARGNPGKTAYCVDGAACDADGKVNGSCTFPIGICLNVSDWRLPACLSLAAVDFELKKAKPQSDALSTLAAEIDAALPIQGPQCFFSDGVVVPLRLTRKGVLKPGKQLVKTKTKSIEPLRVTDVDVAKLVCLPPS